MPTTYTTKPETLRDVADTGPSPMPVTFNPPNTVERLCEYDEGGQSGCRRTQTILALEAEYDTFVSPEMYWGHWDQFCQHENYTYFYKGLVALNIQKDIEVLNADSSNPSLKTHIDKVNARLGRSYNTNYTEEYVRNLFINPPGGFPQLVLETPQFYQCTDLGRNIISIDDIDRPLLDKISSTFVDDINPLLTDLSNRLYIVDDHVYCSDYTKFESNPNNKLGLLMVASNSEKYTEGNAYFFPFTTLSEDDKDFITSLALVELELQGEVVIVNL